MASTTGNERDLVAIKKAIFKLLEEDEEFRYAIAAKVGLLEILQRLEQHDQKFNEILERLDRHEEEIKGIKEENKRIWGEIHKIWEELRRHSEILEKHTRMLGSLGNDIGALTEATLSRFVRDDLLDEIRLSGEEVVEIKRMYVINGYEVYLYIETHKRVIVVEVKTRPSIEDIRRLARIGDYLREKTLKEVRLVLASLKAKTSLDVASEARNNGVELIVY